MICIRYGNFIPIVEWIIVQYNIPIPPDKKKIENNIDSQSPKFVSCGGSIIKYHKPMNAQKDQQEDINKHNSLLNKLIVNSSRVQV
jgi:hypothetical protein